MDKKIFAICLIALAILSAGVVCASQAETVDGIDFKIPSSYEKDTTQSNDSSVLYKDGTDIIMITVWDSNGVDLDAVKLDGDVKKTISGKEGWYSNTPTLTFFTFKEDGKFVSIAAPDKSTIESILD